MPRLHDLMPDAGTVVDLQPEELGGALLAVFASDGAAMLHPGNFENTLFGSVAASAYPRDRQDEIVQAIREAVGWLEGQGLLVSAGGTNGVAGWRVLSRRAKALADPVNWKNYRSASMLPRDQLHPEVAEVAYAAFLRGAFDTAVFESCKSVEVAVRAAATGVDPKHYGTDLMRHAFHPEKGPLTDSSYPLAEREALMHLFAGAIGSYKNPHSHRAVEISPSEAVEMIVLASHLRKIVDSRASRAKPA